MIEIEIIAYRDSILNKKKRKDNSIPMSSLFYTRITKLVPTRFVHTLFEKRSSNFFLQTYSKLFLPKLHTSYIIWQYACAGNSVFKSKKVRKFKGKGTAVSPS